MSTRGSNKTATGDPAVRKLIENDLLDEPVRQFLNGLDFSNEASVVEMNGRRIYLVVRPASESAHESEPWNDLPAKRRHELIDRKIDSMLDPLEAVELAELEERFDRHLDRMAPLPIVHARNLLAQIQLAIASPDGTPCANAIVS